MMGLGKFYTSLEISAYKQTRVSESRARKRHLNFQTFRILNEGLCESRILPFCTPFVVRTKGIKTRRFDRSTVIIKQSEVNNYISSSTDIVEQRSEICKKYENV